MDKSRRKELIEAYRNRRPEMGVIALRCRETGDSFLGASRDVPADFNSARAKLELGGHPNRQLSALWERYGEDGFDFVVLETLECEDPDKDYGPDLEALRELCLAADPRAQKIWR
ncbi:GIY-YIG nuclease family protein [Adlercreutzia faecimuris]|uniref:GIY-YIG nuclease family protein n=1 Tax=Adlercreutzia faecimuris TaxID=2897341 RepID=A0ABS9WJK2_9ACTN|nr:GIY-YIG nuclease family protein [Adlercreutzia sp. JBNU-10]MCI2242672.1 GIY-YIG nuclease family protein [Adlercreutzia sp. JBNU-10]